MKKRKLNADEEWLLEAMYRETTLGRLCIAWARERGTNGNVVTWPRGIIGKALAELQDRGMLKLQPPCKAGLVSGNKR